MKIISATGRICELIPEGNRIKRLVSYSSNKKDSPSQSYITSEQVDEVLKLELGLLHYEKTFDLTNDVRPFIQLELLEDYRDFTFPGVQPSLIRVVN